MTLYAKGWHILGCHPPGASAEMESTLDTPGTPALLLLCSHGYRPQNLWPCRVVQGEVPHLSVTPLFPLLSPLESLSLLTLSPATRILPALFPCLNLCDWFETRELQFQYRLLWSLSSIPSYTPQGGRCQHKDFKCTISLSAYGHHHVWEACLPLSLD